MDLPDAHDGDDDAADEVASNQDSIHSDGVEPLMVLPFTRTSFLSTYRQQLFPFRSTLMNYISKNPKSSKCYQKMIQICKYFFINNPIILVSQLSFDWHENQWRTRFNEKMVYNFDNISSKIWITDTIGIWGNEPPDHFISSVIPKIYCSDAKEMTAYCRSNIILKDLIFLASKCESIWLSDVYVMDDNNLDVGLEKLVETFPCVKNFNYYCPDNAKNSITPKTMKELIKIPHFSSLNRFSINNVPETFDIDTFYAYIKENKTTKLLCYFCDTLSENYKARVQRIVEELGEVAENPDRAFKMPDIYFDGLDLDAHRILYNHFYYLE